MSHAEHLTFIERNILSPVLALHYALYRRTGGRIGHHMPGMPPSLLLHTMGARTGVSRSVILSYARDGEDLLVVASWGGSPTAPGWYYNLKNNAEAHVDLGTKRSSVVAIPVLPGEADYERLWRIVNEMNPNYDVYQRRTTRPIPLVRLTPMRTAK